MAKDLTAIRIDGKLIEALKEISARPKGFYSERTPSWLIVKAVEEFIERNEEPTKRKKRAATKISES